MNNNVVEKTLKSIDNIDRLSDLAAISIYNTSHEAIDKFDVMQEHATPEYVEGEFVQESLLTGVLIGAGIIGVAISAFLIIKKIIESKAKGDPNAAPNTVAGVNLLSPEEINKLFDGWNDKYFKNHPDLVAEGVPGADVGELNRYNSTLLEAIRGFCDEATKTIDGINTLTDADMREAIDELNKQFDSSINMDELVSKTGRVDKNTILQIKAEAEGISKTLREFDAQVTKCIEGFRNKEKNNQNSGSDGEENKISEENIKLLEKALKAKAGTAGAIMDNFRNKCLDGIAQALDAKVKELGAADTKKEETEAKEADWAAARKKAEQRAAEGTIDSLKVKEAIQNIKSSRKLFKQTDDEIRSELIEHGFTEAEINEAFEKVGKNSNESPKESTGSPEPGHNHSQDDESTSIETDGASDETENSETPEGTPKTEPAADKESDDSDRAPIELNGDMKPIIVKACKDQGVPDNYANQYADIIVKNRDLNALRQHLNAGHTGEHKAENDAQTEELINAIRNALYDSLSDTDDESSTGTELTDAEKTKLISEMQSKIPGFNEYTFNRIYDNLKEGTAETITKDIASQAFEELFDSANKINLSESGKRVNEILSKKYALYEFIAKKANIDFSKFNVTKPDLSMPEFNQLVPIFDDVMAGKKTPYQGINEAIKIVLAKYGFDEEQHPTEDMESSSETPETTEDNIREIVQRLADQYGFSGGKSVDVMINQLSKNNNDANALRELNVDDQLRDKFNKFVDDVAKELGQDVKNETSGERSEETADKASETQTDTGVNGDNQTKDDNAEKLAKLDAMRNDQNAVNELKGQMTAIDGERPEQTLEIAFNHAYDSIRSYMDGTDTYDYIVSDEISQYQDDNTLTKSVIKKLADARFDNCNKVFNKLGLDLLSKPADGNIDTIINDAFTTYNITDSSTEIPTKTNETSNAKLFTDEEEDKLANAVYEVKGLKTAFRQEIYNAVTDDGFAEAAKKLYAKYADDANKLNQIHTTLIAMAKSIGKESEVPALPTAEATPETPKEEEQAATSAENQTPEQTETPDENTAEPQNPTPSDTAQGVVTDNEELKKIADDLGLPLSNFISAYDKVKEGNADYTESQMLTTVFNNQIAFNQFTLPAINEAIAKEYDKCKQVAGAVHAPFDVEPITIDDATFKKLYAYYDQKNKSVTNMETAKLIPGVLADMAMQEMHSGEMTSPEASENTETENKTISVDDPAYMEKFNEAFSKAPDDRKQGIMQSIKSVNGDLDTYLKRFYHRIDELNDTPERKAKFKNGRYNSIKTLAGLVGYTGDLTAPDSPRRGS